MKFIPNEQLQLNGNKLRKLFSFSFFFSKVARCNEKVKQEIFLSTFNSDNNNNNNNNNKPKKKKNCKSDIIPPRKKIPTITLTNYYSYKSN